jgi:hypothetical protein
MTVLRKPKQRTERVVLAHDYAAANAAAAARPVYRPTSTAQHLSFVGTLTNGVRVAQYNFTVLAGSAAPTVTAGFAKWSVIDRAQRVGMTVLAGYDPLVMDVPVMFDSVVQQSSDIEGDIAKLDWMAGRGKLFASDGGVGVAGQGDSPLVRVFSTNTNGVETALIPPSCQGLDWVVSGVTFDPNPLRNRAGSRIRQPATVTLTQFVASPGTSYDSPSTRARRIAADRGKYRTVHTSAQSNSWKLVAVNLAHNQTYKAAVDIMNANRLNADRRVRAVRSVTARTLPYPVKVRIPLAIAEGLTN